MELEAIRENYGSDEEVSPRKKELKKSNRESDSRAKSNSRSKIGNNSPGKRRNLDYEDGHNKHFENEKYLKYTKSSKKHHVEKEEEYFKKYDRKKSKNEDYYDREKNEDLKDYHRRGTEFSDRKREHKGRRHDSDIEERTDYDEPEKERFRGYKDQKNDQREDYRHRKKQSKEEEKENELSEFSKSSQRKHVQTSNFEDDSVSKEENKRLVCIEFILVWKQMVINYIS